MMRKYLPAISFTCITLLGNCDSNNSIKPNIILIMADDQGWGDSELYGNQILDTPNLNQLANSGVQFNRFYVSPMCAPTRASLMTGRYNLRTGVTWVCGRTEYLDLNETTLAQILKSNGYSTALYGKWHLGEYGPYHPNERGFDEFMGILEGSTPNYYESHLDYNGKPLVTNGYITKVFTDSAINYIQRNRKNPFFCFLSYNVPHHPYQAPPELFEKYKKRGVDDDKTASVYGMIDDMDENIGRLLKKLKEWDLEENTIVMFMSDNGPAFPRFNDGLRGTKTQVMEGSVRSPFYIAWKNHLPEGKRVYEIAAHIDILPTLLDITGVQKPDSMKLDGISLLSLLEGKDDQPWERIIYAHQNNLRECDLHPGGLRTNQYRLVNWKNGYELYDMIIDPSEKRNIAGDNPELTSELIQKYETWYHEVTSEAKPFPSIPIGYPGYDSVSIIAPDAIPEGGAVFQSSWGCHPDWIQNWSSGNDAIYWDINVYSDGDYHFYLKHNCREESIGTKIQLETSSQAVSTSITEAFYSERQALPNNVNLYSPPVREWALLDLGSMGLSKGKHILTLTAFGITGESVAEVKGLVVIKE
jgi:arylsulfatase A